MGLIIARGGWDLYRARPGASDALCILRVTETGGLLCGFAPDTGVLVAATVRHSWTIGDRVTGLVVERHDDRRSRVLLFRDLVAPDQWRRLNVFLRLSRADA